MEQIPPQRRRRPELTLSVPDREPIKSSSPVISFLVSSSPPLNFSDLERISRLGSGSDGSTIYKVLHNPTGNLYALLVFPANQDDFLRRKLHREFDIFHKLDNPNFVKYQAISDHADEVHILFEYMDGVSLEGIHIADEASLATLTHRLVSALSYLHNRKFVHRDLKPSNILLNSGNEVKIANFGSSSSFMQTIAYYSPERINTNYGLYMYDGYAGDVWSLGLSVLECYLGRYPMAVEREDDWASLVAAICASQPPEPPRTASREFGDFIACCLQIDPATRWTAEQLLRHPFILQNTNCSS